MVASGWLAWPLLLSGHPEQAWDRHRESLTRARELAHPNTLAQVLFIGCTFCQLCSDPGGVLERAEELSALATEQGFPLWRGAAMALEGWALAREGRTEQGIEKIGQGIAAYCATEAELWRPLFLGLSAEAHALEGRQAEARQLLTEAVDRAERTGERWFEAELHRLEGAVMIRGGTLPQFYCLLLIGVVPQTNPCARQDYPQRSAPCEVRYENDPRSRLIPVLRLAFGLYLQRRAVAFGDSITDGT